jgi:hypothetical protein
MPETTAPLQTLVAHPSPLDDPEWNEQVTGRPRHRHSQRAIRSCRSRRTSAHDFLDAEEAFTEREIMYISLGAVVVILLLFLLFRAVSGRRV